MKRIILISSKNEFNKNILDAGEHAQPQPRPSYVYLTPVDGGRKRTMVAMSATNALLIVLGPGSFKIVEERESS